ncbi:serine/threonine protein phosphatase [Actinoplanes sp. NPDC026619]|uniref:serine/threonine protein phosphatase n=1 Tax=Actinoplanes sp. NPDC026619 TaxID=3155798 RepID=UPI0033D41DB2
MTARADRFGAVSTALARLDDQQLGRLVDAAPTTGSGVGGASAALEIAGAPVFVKRIPLTDREREPANVLSTANLFEVPAFCHYGIARLAGPGFGAWRELTANTMTTRWVLAGESEAFPLMYHWRVLPGAAPPAEEHADIGRVVAYWDESAAVRRRLQALAGASASLVLFLEHLPATLHDWLAAQLAAGPEAVAAACAMVERRLRADVAFMNAGGLLHFDAHFRNILTDGHRLYLADLGLAMSPRFDLSPAERDFVARNTGHDAGYVMRELVNWITANVAGVAPVAERYEYVRRCAAGAPTGNVPPPIAALLRRHAPVATVVNDFYWDFFGSSRTTPYPAGQIERALV